MTAPAGAVVLAPVRRVAAGLGNGAIRARMVPGVGAAALISPLGPSLRRPGLGIVIGQRLPELRPFGRAATVPLELDQLPPCRLTDVWAQLDPPREARDTWTG